jgi:hypothetical protein
MAGRTVKQPLTGAPLRLWSGEDGSFPKPGELVEIRNGARLTKHDRRTLNLLLANAWPRITEDVEHVIKKSVLRGDHAFNDRIAETIDRLMTTLVEIQVIRDGKPARRKVQLLGPTDEHRDPGGNLYYRFLPEMIEIIAQSDHWARLQTEVMVMLSSKYSQTLYEMIQKRAGLKSKHSEEFTLEEIRSYLGIPAGKLTRWPDLRRFCLEPAVEEVAALSDCHVKFKPNHSGRAVIGIKLSWFPKDLEGLQARFDELQRHKAGRKARISGKVEVIAAPPLQILEDIVE